MDELKELKAKAFDLIVVLEKSRAELDQVNLKIKELSAKPAAEEVKPAES